MIRNILLISILTILAHSIALGQSYCTPIYSSGCAAFNEAIDIFRLNGANGTKIDHTTGCTSLSGNSYNNYSTILPPLFLLTGNSYSGVISSNPLYSENVRAWIDYNKNGVFENSESVFNLTIPSGAIVPFTISIPNILPAYGLTRMRVRLIFSGTSATIDPCTSVTWGETHDYAINVVPPVSDLAITSIMSPDTLGFCGNVPTPFKVKLSNVGFLQVPGPTNITLNISSNGTTPITQTATFNGALEPFESVEVSFSQPVTFTTDDFYKVSVTISNSSDERPQNDTFKEVIPVYQTPQFQVIHDTFFCTNDSVKLVLKNFDTTKPFSRIVWGNLSEADTTVVVVPSSMQLPLRVERYACRVITNVNLKPSPSPIIKLVTDTTLCDGQSMILKAVDSSNNPNKNIYQWTNINNQTLNLNIDTAMLGRFELFVLDTSTGCSNQFYTNIRRKIRPQYIKQVDTNVCVGQNAIVAINSNFQGVLFDWDEGASRLNQYAIPTNASMLNKSNWAPIKMAFEGCVWYDSVLYRPNPLPAYTVTSDKDVACQGDSFMISIPPSMLLSNSVIWSHNLPSNQASVKIAPSQTTEVLVNVISNKGCSTVNSKLISVLPKPDLQVFSNKPNNVVCSGDPIILYATGAKNLQWLDNNSNDSVRNIPASDLTKSMLYTVIGKTFGCADTAEIRVNLSSSNFNAVLNTKKLNQTQTTKAICLGDSLRIEVDATPKNSRYRYNFGVYNRNQNNLYDSISLYIKPVASANYAVTITDDQNCQKVFTTDIVVSESPVVGYKSPPICQGNAGEISVDFNENYIYSWSHNPGLTLNYTTVSPLVSQSYYVTITDLRLGAVASCSTVVEVPVTVIPRNNAEILSLDTSYLCPTIPVTLIASPPGGYYTLASLGNEYIDNQKLLINKMTNGTYLIQYTYIEPSNQCRVVAQKSFRIEACKSGISGFPPLLDSIEVFPNPFDEYFNIKTDLQKPVEAAISIYDLSGKRVFYNTTKIPAGLTNTSIVPEGISRGMYMLEIDLDGMYRHNYKIEKQ